MIKYYILCKDNKPIKLGFSFLEVMMSLSDLTVGQLLKIEKMIKDGVTETGIFLVEFNLGGKDPQIYSISEVQLKGVTFNEDKN